MCSKRLGPQGEVGDTVVFERLFVSPTPSEGWDRVGTTGEVGTMSRHPLSAAALFGPRGKSATTREEPRNFA